MTSLRKITAVCDLIQASKALAPWVSASLSDLAPGHTGAYAQAVEDFLAAVQGAEVVEEEGL